MCDYCSCRSRPSLDSFGHDHDRVGVLSRRIEEALAGDDGPGFEAARTELVGLLDRHGAEEESGLYDELAGIGVDVSHLHTEHTMVDAALRSDDPDAVRQALAELHAHIHTEEYDLFPAAHQLLDDASWQRLEDHHARWAAVPTGARR